LTKHKVNSKGDRRNIFKRNWRTVQHPFPLRSNNPHVSNRPFKRYLLA